HIRNKEDPEHTHDRIETALIERQLRHITGTELDIVQTTLISFTACEREQVLREIYTHDRTTWTNHLRRGNRRRTTATTDIEHTRAGSKLQTLNCLTSIASPEGVS